MATYVGTTLCKNLFAVNNPSKFEKKLRKYGLRKESVDENIEGLWYERLGNKFRIYGYDRLQFYSSENQHYEEAEEFIQPFLKLGEKAIFIEVGTTKCRFDESCGFAVIITKNEVRYISLHDWVEEQILDMRNKEFHPKITQNE